MCGIVGYTGPREAYPIIIKGLQRLEYRGYDSTGVALLNGGLTVYKKKGRVAELADSLVGENLHAHIGIGHTRWATHGEPSDRNAHPHTSANGKLAMIHNGIIENYAQLKAELIKKGYQFSSDTDTEVLLKFIEDIQKNNKCSLEEAIRIALKRVTGAYVIVVIDEDNPDELILKNLGNEKITPFIQKLDMELAAIEKGGYEHFMLKEIFEQPETIFDCLRGRLDEIGAKITMAGVQNN